MRSGFHQVERVFGDATGPLQTRSMHAPPTILRDNRVSYQFCAGPGAGPNSKAHIFRQQGFTRFGDEIPVAGEGSVGCGIFVQEAPPLLPQLYSGGDDKPPYTKLGEYDENQLKVAFYNEEQDHSPSYLKFYLLIFAKDKAQAQAQEGQSPQKPKVHPMKGKVKY